MSEQFICYMLRTVPGFSDDATISLEATTIVYTNKQPEAIEDIHDELDVDTTNDCLSELASKLMALCRLLITQDLSAYKICDSPLMHYLAIRGIDEKSDSAGQRNTRTSLQECFGLCSCWHWSWPSH